MSNAESTVKGFWEAYGDSSLLVEVTCDAPNNGESLAEHVLDTFGIPRSTSIHGGNLKDLDIKHMDAMAVLNLSLLESLAEGSIGDTIYEPTVDENGKVVFIEVGGSTASLSDIYYQVQTSSYVETCKGVLIRGGTQLPTWKDLDWKTIWANSSYKLVLDVSKMQTNCMSENFSTHAVILFNDPHLDTEFNDGINNLYDIIDPFDKILGYVRFIDAPGAGEATKITYNNSAVIPIQVGGTNPYMGNLQPRPSYDPGSQGETDPNCWLGTGERSGKISDAVKIVLPPELRYEDIRGTTVDKFVKVEEVMLLGRELSLLHAGAINDNAAAAQDPTEDNTVVLIAESSSIKKLHKLDEGKHYAIIYAEVPLGNGVKVKEPYIIFAKDARVNEPRNYGQNTNYKISQFGDSGRFNAGNTGIGTIFPVAENKGYLVDELWVTVSVDSPSIAIYDPEFNGASLASKAINIAHDLNYYISPIMVHELPATIAFNGSIIDQTLSKPDNDPRTVQDFTTTEYEEALDQLDGGGGLELTLPFFNSEQDDYKLASLSSSLYNYMNSGNGTETTYVCGPNTDVSLGESGPAGGVINSITYSYTDSGSYTISVNEGPKLVKPFNGGGPSGPTFKSSESYNARGTIIDSIGNGMFFKVRIDGYGERTAINMSEHLLKIGDVVSCSIHNNPVEG